jgi:hypothetical protein
MDLDEKFLTSNETALKVPNFAEHPSKLDLKT